MSFWLLFVDSYTLLLLQKGEGGIKKINKVKPQNFSNFLAIFL